MIEAVCLGLLALNGFQLWMWWRETHRLIDKIMCKNYPEYVSSQSFLKPKLPQAPRFPDESDIQEQEYLRELNGMLS